MHREMKYATFLSFFQIANDGNNHIFTTIIFKQGQTVV